MENYDFLAIGDITTEPFIRLVDAEATCDLDREHCKLCVRFGDKIEYESAEVCKAVGNSANAAVAAARLGVKTGLLAYIGDDQIGKEDIEELKKNNVGTDMMKIIPGMPTNYHYVLWYSTERTILIKHTPYPYNFDMNMPAPKWIYFSSIAPNAVAYHDQLAEYLKNHPEVKLAYQPGTFQMKLGVERTKGIYERTEIFFCNFEEAQRILKTQETDFKKLMDGIHAFGPKIVVITDGIKGAYVREDNGTYWFMPIYPNIPKERTGAGDAFSSTFTSCILMGKTVEEALLWGPINSMSVTEYVGAQKGLLTPDKIEEYLAKAPADYKPAKI